MTTAYDCNRLVRFTYADFKRRSPSYMEELKKWVLGMTMERDGEHGADREEEGEIIPGFWSWMVEQNSNPEFIASPLFETFVWVDTRTSQIMATGTIAPDDRGVKAEYKLGGDGLWGGVNVRPDWDMRGKGIGKFITAEMDAHIAAHAVGSPRLFHLFTANPIAERIYTKLGFTRNAIGDINTVAFGGERLYSKQY